MERYLTKMKTITNSRGFRVLVEEKYQNEPGEFTRLAQESSAIGPYKEALACPGRSFLWIGQDHHLSREQVRDLIIWLQDWLEVYNNDD